jgi:hypothetical protein
MRRRAIFIAVLLLVVGGGLFLWLSRNPLEAARHRVRLGTDQATVAADVGREPDEIVRQTDDGDESTALRWEYEQGSLYVALDRHGRVVEVCVFDPCHRQPGLWDRVLDWWPW